MERKHDKEEANRRKAEEEKREMDQAPATEKKKP
jgi:hypothetical protein